MRYHYSCGGDTLESDAVVATSNREVELGVLQRDLFSYSFTPPPPPLTLQHHHHLHTNFASSSQLSHGIIWRLDYHFLQVPHCFPACGPGFGWQETSSVAAGLTIDESLKLIVSCWRIGSKLWLVPADPAMSLRAATSVATCDAALVLPFVGGYARLWCDFFNSSPFLGAALSVEVLSLFAGAADTLSIAAATSIAAQAAARLLTLVGVYIRYFTLQKVRLPRQPQQGFPLLFLSLRCRRSSC